MCGNNKHSGPFDGNLYKCNIHGIHDGKPDEGGSAYNDPTKRIELEEQRESRQRRPHNANVLSQRATVMRRGAVRRT
jgi:hypothetical protein